MAYNPETLSFDLPDTDQIYVSGLPSGAGERDLEEYFGSIGVIKTDKKTKGKKIYMYRDKATGALKGDAVRCKGTRRRAPRCARLAGLASTRQRCVVHGPAPHGSLRRPRRIARQHSHRGSRPRPRLLPLLCVAAALLPSHARICPHPLDPSPPPPCWHGTPRPPAVDHHL
jgi:hypothetical protein